MDARLPDIGHVGRWHLGIPAGGLPPGDGGIAFTAAELADSQPDHPPRAAPNAAPADALPADAVPAAELSAAPRIGLHLAMATELPSAGAVTVRLPGYRGKSLIGVLSWLVTHRLARPDAEVCWYLQKQQGPRSVAALLAGLGWQDVQRERDGDLVKITGHPATWMPRYCGKSDSRFPTTSLEHAGPGRLPPARQFSAVLGAHELTFLADYGVFSPDRIDDGTRLLAEVMLRQPPVGTLADIGTGYGPLAIAAIRNEIAARAVATDVDCIALWLAERNAAACGVALDVRCTPDPLQVQATALTVCNVPTHVSAVQSAELMRALAQRAMGGRKLLIVVHASLESRHARYLAEAGLAISRHPGPSHVVLDATGRP
jgi:Methyltransferase small domain